MRHVPKFVSSVDKIKELQTLVEENISEDEKIEIVTGKLMHLTDSFRDIIEAIEEKYVDLFSD